MMKIVLLIAVVFLQWLNIAHAILNQVQVPLDFRSDNDSGIDGNHENAGILKVIGMDGVFVLVAKPLNPIVKKGPGKIKMKNHNVNHGVRLDGKKLYDHKFDNGAGKKMRLMVKNARWHKVPEMSLMHYPQSGRGSAIPYMGDMLSQQFIGRMNPIPETLRKPGTLDSGENEVTSHQENGLQKRKHETMLTFSTRTRARIETWRKRKWSCLDQGRCRNADKVMTKRSHQEDHVNETDVVNWIQLYPEVGRNKKRGRSVDASQLLRCQRGQPPEINLPVNSQLTLDTRGANLDQNSECNWRLKVLDGQGLMVHCYLQGGRGGLYDKSTALTLIPGADVKGPGKIERLNQHVPRGVWYFRSKEVRITFTAGRGWTEGSTFYQCDVLVK